jgi:hypothetical protein
MQLGKISLFVFLLLGIIFFIIKDHKENNQENNQGNNQENEINTVNTHTDDTLSWSTYSPNIIEGMKDLIPTGSGSGDGSQESGCSSCSLPGSGAKLLPVMDPMYNMREICKQSVLLEDHLFQKKKRCRDCCIKHQLTIEALAEEAITLDKDGKCRDLYDLPDKIRTLQKDFIANRDPNEIAQEYRKVRKSLMQRCFNNF